MTFSEKTIKRQTFLTEWNKSFLWKENRRKWKKEKTINERIEIFPENKRERNLKAINCQKLLYAN